MTRKLSFGVGINDADYRVIHSKSFGSVNGKRIRKIVWQCPYFITWTSVMRRSFSEAYKRDNPSYKGVTCCEDWKIFSKFRAWMVTQNYEGLQLDKDILCSGSKLYSPETCAFVPHEVNTLLLDCNASRGEYPIGVCVKLDRKSPYYIAQVRKNVNGSSHIGCYKTPELAHKAWQWEKAAVIERVVCWYAKQDCFRPDIAEALTCKVWKLRTDHTQGVETK